MTTYLALRITGRKSREKSLPPWMTVDHLPIGRSGCCEDTIFMGIAPADGSLWPYILAPVALFGHTRKVFYGRNWS